MKPDQKILAIASAGGHWTQLMRLKSAFTDTEIVFVSTLDQSTTNPGSRFLLVPDANRYEKLSVLKLTIKMAGIIARERPTVIISTGAAPGLIGIALGRLFGARTIWIDSFANVDRLSMSGRFAGHVAHLWLTQWSHLAKPIGPHYSGTIV